MYIYIYIYAFFCKSRWSCDHPGLQVKLPLHLRNLVDEGPAIQDKRHMM